jgi:ABC-type transporter Mla subunit MlaD
MTDENGEKLSGAEIGKDAVQSTIEAAAGAVGEVATILTNAVRDVATAVGDFATEVFEIRDASRKAADDAQDTTGDEPIPAVDQQLDDQPDTP